MLFVHCLLKDTLVHDNVSWPSTITVVHTYSEIEKKKRQILTKEKRREREKKENEQISRTETKKSDKKNTIFSQLGLWF